MPRPKFDITDGEIIFGDDNLGFDSDGHMMIGMGKNVMMDMESGDIHFTIGSNDQSDEDND